MSYVYYKFEFWLHLFKSRPYSPQNILWLIQILSSVIQKNYLPLEVFTLRHSMQKSKIDENIFAIFPAIRSFLRNSIKSKYFLLYLLFLTDFLSFDTLDWWNQNNFTWPSKCALVCVRTPLTSMEKYKGIFRQAVLRAFILALLSRYSTEQLEGVETILEQCLKNPLCFGHKCNS